MWQTWRTTALAGLGAVAAIVAISASWGAYPIGVIVLLIVALAAALWVARVQHNALTNEATPDLAARQHDARIVAEVRNLIPRKWIEWLRTADFGAAWRTSHMEPFFEFGRLNDVEHRPLDPELKDAIEKLFRVTEELTDLWAAHSVSGRNPEWTDTGWSRSAGGKYGEARKMWEESRQLLNNAADPVVAAYDEFIELARVKLVLDIADEESHDPAG